MGTTLSDASSPLVVNKLLTHFLHYPSDVRNIDAHQFLSMVDAVLSGMDEHSPTRVIVLDSVPNADILQAVKATVKIARFIAPIATILCTILAAVPG
jgi:hypothetical protein